jgi:non-lysosomal glucosylceramidase
MEEEAFELMKGVITTTYDVIGYHFQTPEAWDANGRYRAHTYMRPLCIWAVHHALLLKKKKDNQLENKNE